MEECASIDINIMNKLATYLRIKFADYNTASAELKSRVNPDLLERWKWYNDKVTQNDDPESPMSMQDKIDRLDYVRSNATSKGNKALRRAMSPDRQKVTPSGKTIDSTAGQLNRSFGKNYEKYNRYEQSDNFNPDQLLGDLSSQNLTDKQRQALASASDTIKGTRSVFSKPNFANGYAVTGSRRGLQTEYMKQGYTPDQAFVLAEAQSRKDWNADKREGSPATPVSQPAQPNATTQQSQPTVATTTTTQQSQSSVAPTVGPIPTPQQPQPTTEQTPTPNYSTDLLNKLNVNTNTGGIVGAVGGGIGGGYLGNKATGWVTNKLGLTDEKGGIRKWLGRGLRTAGTLGGALGGAYYGNMLGGKLYQ